MKTAGEAVRNVRVARSSGATVEVVDVHHPESPVEDDGTGLRWAAYCVDHGVAVFESSWRDAKRHLAAPEAFCDGCRATIDANGGPLSTGTGFSEEERARALEARRAKAEERRQEREAAKAARAKEVDAEKLWAEFALRSPSVASAWTPEERKDFDLLRISQTEHMAAARKERRKREAAETELYDPKVAPKPKRAKELEAEIARAEEERDAQLRAAKVVRGVRDKLARRAFLRGAAEVGWSVRKNGTGFVLARGDRDEPVRLPPDYLPTEELEALR